MSILEDILQNTLYAFANLHDSSQIDVSEKLVFELYSESPERGIPLVIINNQTCSISFFLPILTL